MKSIGVVMLLLVLAFPFAALGSDYEIKYNGTNMVFPLKDSVPDLNLSDFVINLDKIPEEFVPMISKIYRGQAHHPASRLGAGGSIWYIFLTRYDQENNIFEFAVARSSSMRSTGEISGLS